MRGLLGSLVLVVFLGASGCGYGFVRYGGGFGDVRSVAIVTPSNSSYEPGVENIVADALRREFLRRGAARVVNDPEGADLVISGKVRSVRARGRSFSSVIFTVEYELTLSVDLDATQANGEEIPIDDRAQQERELYLASADIEATRKNRLEAMRRLATVIAGRVADVISESLAP